MITAKEIDAWITEHVGAADLTYPAIYAAFPGQGKASIQHAVKRLEDNGILYREKIDRPAKLAWRTDYWRTPKVLIRRRQ